MAVLAPGFGHQGARIGQLDELFGSASSQVLVSASRSILSAGPAGLAKAIDAHRAELPQ
jgi:orotidine-5'-phosphate decarboxylase